MKQLLHALGCLLLCFWGSISVGQQKQQNITFDISESIENEVFTSPEISWKINSNSDQQSNPSLSLQNPGSLFPEISILYSNPFFVPDAPLGRVLSFKIQTRLNAGEIYIEASQDRENWEVVFQKNGNFQGWAEVKLDNYVHSELVLRFVYTSGRNTNESVEIDALQLRNGAFADTEEEIRVYPNPFQDKLTLEFAQPLNEAVSASLYDLQGKQLWISTATESQYTEWKMPDLTPGPYLLNVQYQGKQYSYTLIHN